MDERSKRAQMERKRRIRRKKQRRRVLISALVEVLILAVLALAFCWDRGLSAKVSGVLGIFDRPPATELDVSGVNSSNVLLMDVKKRKGHWKSKWGRADLSGIHDEDHDCNCGVGSIFRSGS